MPDGGKSLTYSGAATVCIVGPSAPKKSVDVLVRRNEMFGLRKRVKRLEVRVNELDQIEQHDHNHTWLYTGRTWDGGEWKYNFKCAGCPKRESASAKELNPQFRNPLIALKLIKAPDKAKAKAQPKRKKKGGEK